MTAYRNKNARSKRRGGNYKLVFKPEEYTGKLSHWNEDWENGPLVTWKNNTLRRCYQLINNRKVVAVWAAIYKMEQHDEQPIAVYTTDNEWNNDVNNYTGPNTHAQ